MKNTSHFLFILLGIYISAGATNSYADDTHVISDDISQQPLTLVPQIPGNLFLALSVEFPTVLGRAYQSAFNPSTSYTAGYFDPNKCYAYIYKGDNSDDNYFKPVEKTMTGLCSNRSLWSGNFLNWVQTSTIDPFRKVLTGGYRVKDTVTETWLQKSKHKWQRDRAYYPPVTILGKNLKGYVPLDIPAADMNKNFYFALSGLGSQIVLTKDSTVTNQNPIAAENIATPYEGNYITTLSDKGIGYKFNVRVAVCLDGLLEGNCIKKKSGYYKPEGLLQKNTSKIRYSVLSYLNEDTVANRSISPGGGVLRVEQKYISPYAFNDNLSVIDNPNKEWAEDTGIFIKNPDQVTSAMGFSIADSGVINYINKFGELNNNFFKVGDYVSELYYATLRYMRNMEPIAAYNNYQGDKQRAVDNFPVIGSWKDPIKYSCQKNAILGIGDPGTYADGNLPGSLYPVEYRSTPNEVKQDTSINVSTLLKEMELMEGTTINPIPRKADARGKATVYLASLAYWAHTRDIRPDIKNKKNKVTADTYWVDVGSWDDDSRVANQYWLGAKYGGFKVPASFDVTKLNTSTLTDDMWTTSGDRVTIGKDNAKRPDNYFLAADAEKVSDSLEKAFNLIVTESQKSSTGNVSTSSSYVDTGMVFYTNYSIDSDDGIWSGDLIAYKIDPASQINTKQWSLSDKLTATSAAGRKLYTTADDSSSKLLTRGIDFKWDSLTAKQKSYFNGLINGSLIGNSGELRVNYLRGSRENERNASYPSRYFERRSSLLGDIVNSNPSYIFNKNYGYSLLTGTFSVAASSYKQFINSQTMPIVAVGANDGILHIVNANTGDELLGYVPNAVIPNLENLTQPNHAHLYYVDGKTTAGHVFNGTYWQSIVVGTTGAGGRAVFAVDVTNAASGLDKDNILWEFTDDELGYTLMTPIIVPLASGEFGVVFSSGYGLTDKKKNYIWILNAVTGKLLRKIAIPDTDGGELGSVLATSITTKGVAEKLYVPDTRGHIWRVNLTNNSVQLLFTAVDRNGNNQSITAPLESAINQDGNNTLFFGTGSFYKLSDKYISNDPPIETFYAIVDDGQTVSRAELLAQQITEKQTTTGQNVRVISDNAYVDSNKGWYIDLIVKNLTTGSGERVIDKASVSDKVVLFNSIKPSADLCDEGGTTYTMAVSRKSGGLLQSGVWDVNGDGVIDANDMIDGSFISGIENGGIISPPTEVIKDGKTYLCFGKADGSGLDCVLVDAIPKNGFKTWREAR